MNYIADLHIHSPFSRATSPDSCPAGLAAWARLKGIQVIGTGDCTHPGWFALLKEQLEPAEPGLYRLRDESMIPTVLDGGPQSTAPVRFLLSAEISSIYKRDGVTRKVHNLLYLPDFASVERLNARLAGIGNIESDGRPILGLDSRNLLEIMLECSPEAFLVPAHIWTPWFSLFGSKSGFDSIEACFGDLSAHIFALETGLSSDPDMNRLISALDRCALVSNSDCHSPSKLGREATIFNTDLDFFALREALKQNRRDRLVGTIEFYPEEGKYHCDGHRDCKVCLDPHETRRLQGRCPVCGKPVTVGVHHRVLELADRDTPLYPPEAPGFHSLIPLPELLGELLQVGPASKQVLQQYSRALARFGSEFNLLLWTEPAELAEYEPLLAEAVVRMREGRVIRTPGYDGQFGMIRAFEDGELDRLSGQAGLFGDQPARRRIKAAVESLIPVVQQTASRAEQSPAAPAGPNPEQSAAIQAEGQRVLVAAGPGTGKTFTLVSRLQYLLEQGADPDRMVAITFTTRTAEEMRERLSKRCGAAAERLFVGTFHAFCLEQLRQDNPSLIVVGPESRQRLLKRLFPGLGSSERTRISQAITASCSGTATTLDRETELYVAELVRLNALDLDAIIPVCVQLMQADEPFRQRMQQRAEHLFVDEFQDLNNAQYELVEQLGLTASIFAIGDPDQAIYGFRGGDLRYFFRFAEVAGTVILPLKTTYRIPRRIVQAATALISRNLICSGLPLAAAAGCSEGRLEFQRVVSPAAEAELVVSMIEELVGGLDSFSLHSGRARQDQQKSADYSFADIAILFRLGRQAEELAEALARRGIPYQLVGATPFYQSTPLRPLYHLLQAAAGSDELAIWLALFAELKGVGAATLDRLDTELPLRGDFFALAAPLVHSPTTSHALQELALMLERFRQTAATDGLAVALEAVLAPFAIDPDQEDARRLLLLAQGFGHDLVAFSNHLQKYAAATVYDDKAEAVSLMSCHSAKGLEFPVVFMVGLEEGIFPCSLMGPPDVEEERRLFYVGLTRAKERVILTCSAYRSWMGQGSRERSCFIGELPADLLDIIEPSAVRRVRKPDTSVQMELF